MEYISPDDECRRRNNFLSTQYLKIPSYALWQIHDIETQTVDERITWWSEIRTKFKASESVLKTLNIMKVNEIKKSFLLKKQTQAAQETQSAQATQSVQALVDEFCPKRLPNDCYCDI